MRSLFRKRLGVGEMPTKVGVLLVDPVSCWVIGRWLRTGQTFTDRPVQLFEQEKGPRLVLGRIGETLREFCLRHQVEIAGQQVIVNGMLSGRDVSGLDARIESHTEAVTIRPQPDIETPTACIACGWCIDVCPTSLRPIHLMQLAQRVPSNGDYASTREERESLHCVGCGLCSYVCPTRLPLMRETLRLRDAVIAAGSEAPAGMPQ